MERATRTRRRPGFLARPMRFADAFGLPPGGTGHGDLGYSPSYSDAGARAFCTRSGWRLRRSRSGIRRSRWARTAGRSRPTEPSERARARPAASTWLHLNGQSASRAKTSFSSVSTEQSRFDGYRGHKWPAPKCRPAPGTPSCSRAKTGARTPRSARGLARGGSERGRRWSRPICRSASRCPTVPATEPLTSDVRQCDPAGDPDIARRDTRMRIADAPELR
jgi:hypothetical protein